MTSSYQKLSIAEKRAVDLARVREQPIQCPECGTSVMPADAIAHLKQRCDGKREPGPGSKWVTHPEAMSLGVPRTMLHRWTKRGHVRWRGEHGSRQYLLRDLVEMETHRLKNRRR